jgi:hypothetical protein
MPTKFNEMANFSRQADNKKKFNKNFRKRQNQEKILQTQISTKKIFESEIYKCVFQQALIPKLGTGTFQPRTFDTVMQILCTLLVTV